MKHFAKIDKTSKAVLETVFIDDEDVLDVDDEDQEPEDERQDAADEEFVDLRAPRAQVREALLEGVERARADVAEDDADGSDGEGGERARREML